VTLTYYLQYHLHKQLAEVSARSQESWGAARCLLRACCLGVRMCNADELSMLPEHVARAEATQVQGVRPNACALGLCLRGVQARRAEPQPFSTPSPPRP